MRDECVGSVVLVILARRLGSAVLTTWLLWSDQTSFPVPRSLSTGLLDIKISQNPSSNFSWSRISLILLLTLGAKNLDGNIRT